MSKKHLFAPAILQAGKILATVMTVVHLFVMVNYKVSSAGIIDVLKMVILECIHKSAKPSTGSK